MTTPSTIAQTFECRPTAPGLQNDALPDELMIDWGGLPAGTQATIYLPAIAASDILVLAGRLYCGQPFTKLDDQSIGLDATGISYVPLPPGPLPGPNYAGLLTLTLPPGLQLNSRFNVTVRQLTTVAQVQRSDEDLLVPQTKPIRQALGAFQINITVQSAASLLTPAERNLAFFRWVSGQRSSTDRWSPVLDRYVAQIAESVKAFGGNPDNILPSPTGDWYQPPPGDGFLVITFVEQTGGPVVDVADVFLGQLNLSGRWEFRGVSTSVPLTVLDLPSTDGGIFELQILPNQHKAYSQFVTISEGQLTRVTVTLEPN
jgi:hypothetical protein